MVCRRHPLGEMPEIILSSNLVVATIVPEQSVSFPPGSILSSNRRHIQIGDNQSWRIAGFEPGDPQDSSVLFFVSQGYMLKEVHCTWIISHPPFHRCHNNKVANLVDNLVYLRHEIRTKTTTEMFWSSSGSRVRKRRKLRVWLLNARWYGDVVSA